MSFGSRHTSKAPVGDRADSLFGYLLNCCHKKWLLVALAGCSSLTATVVMASYCRMKSCHSRRFREPEIS